MFCITNVTFILPLPPLAISILPSHSALSSRPSMLSKHSSCSANKAAQSIWQTTSFLITTTTTATTIIICNHYYFYQVKVPTFLPLRPQCQPQVTLVLLWPYFSDRSSTDSFAHFNPSQRCITVSCLVHLKVSSNSFLQVDKGRRV